MSVLTERGMLKEGGHPPAVAASLLFRALLTSLHHLARVGQMHQPVGAINDNDNVRVKRLKIMNE